MKYFLYISLSFLCLFYADEASANVCGSSGSRFLVPDHVSFDARGKYIPYQDSTKTRSGLVSYPVSFVSACSNHDRCYGEKGTPKSKCDTAFYRELLSACRAGVARSAPEDMRRSCIEIALLYNDVVRGQEARKEHLWGYLASGNSGCNAYKKAQGNKNAKCD